MIPVEVLTTLYRAGVTLVLDDGRLRYQAEAGAYTDDLRSLVAANRDEVVAHLRAWDEIGDPGFDVGACLECGLPCHRAHNPHPGCEIEPRDGRDGPQQVEVPPPVRPVPAPVKRPRTWDLPSGYETVVTGTCVLCSQDAVTRIVGTEEHVHPGCLEAGDQ